MEDVPEEIDIGSYDWLLVEEVVGCERYAGVVRFWDFAEHFRSAHGGKILHDEFQLGIFLGNGEGYMALGSTKLMSRGQQREGRSFIVTQKMLMAKRDGRNGLRLRPYPHPSSPRGKNRQGVQYQSLLLRYAPPWPCHVSSTSLGCSQ